MAAPSEQAAIRVTRWAEVEQPISAIACVLRVPQGAI